MKENMKKSVMMIIQNDTIKCFKEKPKDYLIEIVNDENIQRMFYLKYPTSSKGKKTDYKFNFLEFVSCLKVELMKIL